jgi:hypothetical protein
MRKRFTWIAVGAIVVVAVFAGVDALRSDGKPRAFAERDRVVTTTPTETAAVLMTGHRPVMLTAGRVTTDVHSTTTPVVTFTVPLGWYGYQDETGFALGMGLVGEEVDLVPGGIFVNVVDSTLAHAARTLEQVEDIQVKSPIRIGGSPGRRFAQRLGLHRDVTLHDLGLPGVVVPPNSDVILLSAGDKTLVIRRAFTSDADRAEINGVLMSFRFRG